MRLVIEINSQSQLNVTNQEQTAIKTQFLLDVLAACNIMSSFSTTSEVSDGAGKWVLAASWLNEINGRRRTKMDLIRKLYVKADEFARGQTMTEYALILAAVAVVVVVGYQTMGSTITTLLGSVDSQL
jgi:Flp pilus assembly pilin Flp